MTNALTVYERMNELTTAAQALHASGFFSDVRTQAQAMVKVMAGAEIGLPPFASMAGIHIVQGKPVLGANVIATLVDNNMRYSYTILTPEDRQAQEMTLEWKRDGKVVGRSSFTMAEAQAAQLTGKDTWKKYPSDMLFARALTRGARRYAPGIFGGAPVYTPDEMGVETDEEGHIIEGQIVTAEAPKATPQSPASKVAAPPPDDEVAVRETPAAEFVATAAALIGVDADEVKARLHGLGYSRIPGKPDERVNAYRQLRDAQEPLFADDTAQAAALATAQGEMD